MPDQPRQFVTYSSDMQFAVEPLGENGTIRVTFLLAGMPQQVYDVAPAVARQLSEDLAQVLRMAEGQSGGGD